MAKKPSPKNLKGRQISVEKPAWSAYETLLSVSLGGLLLGIILLALLLNRYEFQLSP